jgi:2-keto-4-pentenoate hydratase/2-oxohepta-3-ene-1,7-dioic acid hydratase in catechol pathway
MRLASVRQSDGATRLWAADHGGGPYYDVVAAAAAIHPEFMEIRDVGSLYRAGLHAIDAVREVVSGLRSNRDGQDLSTLKLAPPVTNPGSIVCVGRNYMAHVGESDAPVPERPLLFSKFPNALVGHEEGVVLHSLTCELDYEGELAVVIGQEARHVARDDAMSCVGGYTVLNDISARDLQRSDPQWIRGKSLDTFCPLGPVFVTGRVHHRGNHPASRRCHRNWYAVWDGVGYEAPGVVAGRRCCGGHHRPNRAAPIDDRGPAMNHVSDQYLVTRDGPLRSVGGSSAARRGPGRVALMLSADSRRATRARNVTSSIEARRRYRRLLQDQQCGPHGRLAESVHAGRARRGAQGDCDRDDQRFRGRRKGSE